MDKDVETIAKLYYDRSYADKKHIPWEDLDSYHQNLWRNCATENLKYNNVYGRLAYKTYQGSQYSAQDFDNLDFLEQERWGYVAVKMREGDID